MEKSDGGKNSEVEGFRNERQIYIFPPSILQGEKKIDHWNLLDMNLGNATS